MIANKVYTRDEMREEHIITSDYQFIDKAMSAERDLHKSHAELISYTL